MFLNRNAFISFPLWGFYRKQFGDPNVRKLGYNITYFGYTYNSNLGFEYNKFWCENVPKIPHISPILGIPDIPI